MLDSVDGTATSRCVNVPWDARIYVNNKSVFPPVQYSCSESEVWWDGTHSVKCPSTSYPSARASLAARDNF